jgi:hypothetical protein
MRKGLNTPEWGALLGRRNPDKSELIRKLKTVKDPRERDRILHLLAGQEPPAAAQLPIAPQTGPLSMGPLPTQIPGPEPKQDEESSSGAELPEPPVKGLGLLIGAVMPLFFLLIGLVLILRFIGDIKGGDDPKNLMTGIMFIIFGLIGFYKLSKGKQKQS